MISNSMSGLEMSFELVRTYWTNIQTKADEVQGFYDIQQAAFDNIKDYLQDAEGANLATLQGLQADIEI